MLGLGVLPGIILSLRILFLPESPRYLVGRGEPERARIVLKRILEDMPFEAASTSTSALARAESGETEMVLHDIVARAAAEKSDGGLPAMLEPAVILSVAVGCVLSFLQHAVGIESIIYYSPHIFQAAGVASQRSAILGTVAMGLVKLIFESYALLHVDRIGRRPLLLVGALGVTFALFTMGTTLTSKLGSEIGGTTVSSLVFFGAIAMYMAFHALSFGPITWLVLSEIFPSQTRGKAMGIATTINRGTSFVVSLTFLSLSERLDW